MTQFPAFPGNDYSTHVIRAPRSPAKPTTDDAVQSLIAEMNQRWRDDDRVSVETLLDGRPDWLARAEFVVPLLCEEVCLRQENGDGASISDVLTRFPQWRSQLEVFLACNRMIQSDAAQPQEHECGEIVEGFLLLAELGRGATSTVFLASQISLSDRPVVLKIVPRQTYEHLSLARLQHTHIVPLYSIHEDAERDSLLLCMPYFGSQSLAQVLDRLRDTPMAERTGRHLLDGLDRSVAGLPSLPAKGVARMFLSRISFVSAVCWIGACLADAIAYAHERDLIHLDVKPSNVLLTAEGQPMLLDFHLAQHPIALNGDSPVWVGGTPAYMSPEQTAMLAEIRDGRSISVTVDGRSDVYSLGVLLCEALGVSPGAGQECKPPSWLAEESPGLAALLTRCLAQRAEDRYGNAADVAADLRRHLNNRPLRGVPNRSIRERWHKWRQRNPINLFHLFAVLLLAAVLLGGAMWLQRRSMDTANAARQMDLQSKQIQRQRLAVEKTASAWNRYAVGNSLLRREEYKSALPHLKVAADLDPNVFCFQFDYGRCAYHLDRANDAIAAFTKCIALSTGETRARCYVNRGLAYEKLDDKRNASLDFGEALALQPGMRWNGRN